MLAYLLKRVAMTLVVVVLLMAFLGVIVHLIPGDPVRVILGPRASPELSAIVRQEMDLNSSVPAQVYHFAEHAFQGDLGRDFISQVPVTHLIGSALPHTLILAAVSLALAALVGIPLGVVASRRPNSLADKVTGIMSISLITMPAYVAGLFLLLIFAVKFNVLPAIGTGSLSHPLDYLKHLALPTVALALTWIGYLARLTRTGMFEVLGTNYIRTARAFGLHPRSIYYKYALKNAIIPTIAVLGVGLGTLIGNAVFVEIIFTRAGLGTLILDSIETRNFTIVRGTVLVVAVFIVLANLLADLSYRLLDPRIRLEHRSAST
jgi:peptide/nickel transport system permease protein